MLQKYMFNVNIIVEVLIMENNNEVNNLEKENLKNEKTNINKGKSNKKKLWIIISLIIVIAITGIIVYACLS